MGPYSDNMKLQAAAQVSGQDSGAIRGASERGGRGLSIPQAAKDAPAWDQMRARIGGKLEGLQQAASHLATALGPILETTGKNTVQPAGYANRSDMPPPNHDSQLITFMVGVEDQITAVRDQIEWMTRALPFDSAPF